MKGIIFCLMTLATALTPVSNGKELIFNAAEMQFKAQYHRWAAYIYDNPQIMLSSVSASYTEMSQYADIVKLGKTAVPFIAQEMMKPDSDFGIFLGEAILKIQGWKETDFDSPHSLQELNAKIIARLRKEKTIPEERK